MVDRRITNPLALELRRRAMLEAEKSQPWSWWYLSYVGDEGWKGTILIYAPGMATAVLRTHELKISPGGEVAGFPLPSEFIVPPKFQNRLLNKEELEEVVGPVSKGWPGQ